jgi:hypothetical protein
MHHNPVTVLIFGVVFQVACPSATCFQQWLPIHRSQPNKRLQITSLFCQLSPTGENRRVAIVLPYDGCEDAIDYMDTIAARFDLPIVSLQDSEQYKGYDDNTSDQESEDPSAYSHLLTAIPYPTVNTYALAIHANSPHPLSSKRRKRKATIKLDPIYVDLCPASNTRLGYRMNQMDGGGEELLLKALGLKKMIPDKPQEPLVVYDLTAGLARDSLIILNAFIGYGEGDIPRLRLHMMERDPIVASLVLDAMRRLKLLAELDDTTINIDYQVRHAKRLIQCLTAEEGDAVDLLRRLSLFEQCKGNELVPFPPDVCYLDPMFPPRKKKSSAVKKDMSMLHSLLGTAEISQGDDSAEGCRIQQEQELIKVAYSCATRRVVVKRPIGAPPLGYLDIDDNADNNIISPSYDIRGSVNRWDVYVIT